jgi:hypothetical protein
VSTTALKQEGEALLDDLCARVAEIAAVPPPNVDGFRLGCEVFIRQAVSGIVSPDHGATIKELQGVVKDALRLRKRLARLKAAGELDGLDNAYWNRVLREDATRSPDDPHDVIVTALVPLLSDLVVDAKAATRERRGNRLLPESDLVVRNEHRHAHELIMSLESLAVGWGGGFSFSHHPPQTGSLIEGVTLLRKYFPEGFFPEILTATEQRDLAAGRRAPMRLAALIRPEYIYNTYVVLHPPDWVFPCPGCTYQNPRRGT